MRKDLFGIIRPAAFLAAAFFFAAIARMPAPPSYLENPAPLTRFSSFDLAGVALGFRRFAADIAWIQLLQYVGSTFEEDLSDEERFLLEYGSSKVLFGINFLDDKKAAALKEKLRAAARAKRLPGDFAPSPPRDSYPEVYARTLRVVRLDPGFFYAYLFSGGALAWNYDRPEEALAILREGIRNNPGYWQYHLYVSAILYKTNMRHDEMLALLERAIKEKDAPNMVRVIVANYYEKTGRAADCLRVWLDVVETKDSMYYEKGLEKITKLSESLGIKFER